MASIKTTYPRATAYHEAGHAIVAWSLGLPVGTIRIRADDADGSTDIGPADHLSPSEQVAVCCAGSAAEDMFDCETHELASFNDNVKIMELIEDHRISEQERGPALRAEGYRCARSHLEKHRSKVVKLAEQIVECGQVDAIAFLQLMEAEEEN